MPRCKGLVRPPSITCACGRAVPVGRFGPVPVMCRTCADAKQTACILAWREREKAGEERGRRPTAVDGVEELEDGRKALGCQLEHLRARVAALARDMGLPPPAFVRVSVNRVE